MDKPQINLEHAEDINCEKCNCEHFVTVFSIKRISPLMSPTGKEVMIPIQTFACTSCGHINEGF